MLWLVPTLLPMLLTMAFSAEPARESPDIQRPKALEEAREEATKEKEREDDEAKKPAEEEPRPEAPAEPTEPTEPTEPAAQPAAEAAKEPASRPETPIEGKEEPKTPLEQPSPPKVEATAPKPADRPATAMPEPWEPDPNAKAKEAWRQAHRGFLGRLAYAVGLSGYAFIPPPPVVAGGLGVFVGGKLVPKFRGRKVLRDRSLGYWGQVNPTAAPFSILHRHMFAIAGSGGPRTSIFYEVGGGFVHYGCCGSDLPGGTVGAFAGWRVPTASERAFVLGVPVMIDMLANADVRGSIGIGVALTNI
jgi:hypothetical protein